MKRSPEMQTFIEKFQEQNFGRTETSHPDCCVTCGSKKVGPGDFQDEVSVKEFSLSRMCQICQDQTFGKE